MASYSFDRSSRPRQLGEWVAEDGTETTLFVRELLGEVRELQRKACSTFATFEEVAKTDGSYLVDLQKHRGACRVCVDMDRVADWLSTMAQRDDERVREWRMAKRRTT